MLGRVFDAARWLDRWLQTHGGWPYNALLTVGLVLEMENRIQHLPDRWRLGSGDLAGTALALAMETALLIHQLAELSERRERRRARRAAAQGKAD